MGQQATMKILLLLAAASIADGAHADTPSALKPVLAIAKVMELQDLIHNTVEYRVDFCTGGDCDMFQADARHLQVLSDYGLLFASTDYEYLKHMATPLDKNAVADVLARDGKEYGCATGKAQLRCVMHALFRAGQLKRSSFKSGDADSYEELDEDGQYIPGGYD